jgi:hypothetical protein
MADQTSPTDADRARDRDELRAFVYELWDLLRTIVEDGRFIPNGWADDVQGAWVRVQERFAELINSIDGTNIPWNDLDQHGLTGEELRLKRRGWRQRIFAFGRRINRPWVRSALRWANTILESLAAVFPVAGAIKEFKESVENLIEDAEIDAKRKRRGRLRNRRNPHLDVLMLGLSSTARLRPIASVDNCRSGCRPHPSQISASAASRVCRRIADRSYGR